MLSPEIVGRIAAGEVVDRPASVLKELLDNSIDARSTKIKVLLIDAGVKRLEVEDDGMGLGAEDLKVCTLRHATSKVSKIEDLEDIHSLGFRGEALAAISSVSKLSIESVVEGESAWKWETLGSTQGELTPCARSRGTRVRVDELFFNVPARKKFLKSLSSEFNECLQVLRNMALSHPKVAFQWDFLNEKGELKESFQASSQSLEERFLGLSSFEGEHFEVEAAKLDEGIEHVHLVFYRSPVASRFKKDISLIVNGRPITDARLPFALREAYNGLIEVSRFPVGVVKLEVDPSLIDVNIHPQKKEVRWPKSFSLPSLIYSLLRPHLEVTETRSQQTVPPVTEGSSAGSSLMQDDSSASLLSTHSSSASSSGSTATSAPTGASNSPSNFSQSSSRPQASDLAAQSWDPQLFKESRAAQGSFNNSGVPEKAPEFRFQDLRVVGEVGAAWIVCESSEGLILIDQHAAHERVNFERILRSKDLIRSKALLIPFEFPLPQFAEEDALELLGVLEDLGFELSDESLSQIKAKSAKTLEFIAVPEADRKIEWDSLVEQLFDDIRDGEATTVWKDRLRYKIAASLSCHGSVRRGQRLGNDQIKELLKQMDAIQWGGLCPHGRPVWLSLSHTWIEESFHR